MIHGSEGRCHIGAAKLGSPIFDRHGNQVWEMAGSIADAHQQEHRELADSIRAGMPIVELGQMADSSLEAVMGRMAAYTGQRVTWTFAAEESKIDPVPQDLTLESTLPPPEFAIPGETKLA